MSTRRPPRDAYEEYIDPDKRHMAIRTVKNDDGKYARLYNGRPAKWTFKNFQVVGLGGGPGGGRRKGAGARTQCGGQRRPGPGQPASSPARCSPSSTR